MRRWLCAILIGMAALSGAAQRRITPVTPAPSAGDPVVEKPDTTRRQQPRNIAHIHDSAGNVILIDTITGQIVPDTLTMLRRPPKMEYPLLYNVSVGVDLWDPAMRAFGQHYGLIGFSAGLSMHNRYRPTVEVGLGCADNTPDGSNFTYKSPVAPYFKLGCDYNFFYNSNPDYELYAGVRFGLSPFSFSIADATLHSGYWDETTTFDVPSQRVTASYVEVLAGVRVRVWRNWSLGWNVRFHGIMGQTGGSYGKPWYIPGYGTTGTNWGGSFSIYYTIPLNRRTDQKVINKAAGGSLGSDSPQHSTSNQPLK